MTKYISRTAILLIGLMPLAFGCNAPAPGNKSETHHDSAYTNIIEKDKSDPENTSFYNPSDALWEYQFDTAIRDFKLVKLRQYDKDTLTIMRVENIVNKTWPKIQIKYLRTSGDTVFIGIPDSEILTQRMGTSGADAFMISTTYSFTDLKGVNYVSCDFEVGDHANPGVYSRARWKAIIR